MNEAQSTSWIPHSYQETGVMLMIGQACAGLLYKPGRGKTSVVYMAFRILQDKKYVDKMLVICPLRPAYIVWPEQKNKYDEFKHFKVNVLHGKDKEKLLADDSADIYVINPEGLMWLFGAKTVRDAKGKSRIILDPKRLAYVKQKFPMLVVDESTKFREYSTNRFKLMKQVIPHFKRRYIMTGSFTPKGLLGLFGQVYILDEGQSLGRYITHYRNEYFFPSGYGGYDYTPQPGAARRIADKISDLVQVVERGTNEPELFYDDWFIQLPPNVMKQYKMMENEMVAIVQAGKVVAANAAVASSKCRQICNGALYIPESNGEWELIHDLKIEALSDMIEQLQGAPLLVTYEFDSDRERLEKALKIPCISTGKIKHDNATIKAFSRGELPVVMGHPQSISLGTDGLQDSCCDIAMFGVTWNFLDYEQVIDRVRRQGSKSKHVTVRRILAKGTVDERVIEVLEKRDTDQRTFLSLLQDMSPHS